MHQILHRVDQNSNVRFEAGSSHSEKPRHFDSWNLAMCHQHTIRQSQNDLQNWEKCLLWGHYTVDIKREDSGFVLIVNHRHKCLLH